MKNPWIWLALMLVFVGCDAEKPLARELLDLLEHPENHPPEVQFIDPKLGQRTWQFHHARYRVNTLEQVNLITLNGNRTAFQFTLFQGSAADLASKKQLLFVLEIPEDQQRNQKHWLEKCFG